MTRLFGVLLFALAGLSGLRAAEPTAMAGRTLDQALEALRGQGLPIVYSSALVRPEFKVAAEPAGSTPAQRLASLLSAHGLAVQDGPSGSLLIVKGVSPATAFDGPGVVSFVKVLSDKVPDLSSLEAWQAAYIRPGMSEEEKALAAWKTTWTFQHQDVPPNDYIHPEANVSDALKLFNIYGYSYCGMATANVETLARHVGLQARSWTVNHHVVPEVLCDGQWRMLDASQICWFPKPDGKAASLEEVKGAVTAWLNEHQDLKSNDDRLREYHKADGWTGWRRGPDLLSRCPSYDKMGWLPSGHTGWYAQMQQFDGANDTPFLWEPGYSTGYQVNIQLRSGERLTRNWFNKGQHINALDDRGAPGCLADDDLALKRYDGPMGGSLAPGRVGNGTHEYTVPLANGAFRGGVQQSVNLACTADDRQRPAVRVREAGRDGVLVFRMACSYVYLGGELLLHPVLGPGGSVVVAVSDSNGETWKDAARFTEPGAQKVDLKPFIGRRYDFLIRCTLKGAGTGIDLLKAVCAIQHSQRVLPALGQGENTITFSAGPPHGTVTFEPTLCKEFKDKQAWLEDYKPEARGVELHNSGIVFDPTGEVVFKLKAPGDVMRLRLNSNHRLRDERDVLECQASFDGGRTWKALGTWKGALPGVGQKEVRAACVDEVPAGTREVRIKYRCLERRNTVMLFGLRFDADYREPHGGFAPVKVVYRWEEQGGQKESVHRANKKHEVWKINCIEKPLMKSIIIERE